MVTSEDVARVLRLYEVEGWKPSTIAREAGLHRATVRRILERRGVVRPVATLKRRMVEPYLPFIQEALSKYPDIAGTLLFRMVRKRGYGGRNAGHFRKLLGDLRPKKSREAYLTLETLPGEEAQVDWVHCGRMRVGAAERPLMGFVMTLSYSRRIFLRFFLSQGSWAFYQGIVEAFAHFGGAPKRMLIDNLKSGVVERAGSLVRFHEDFLRLGAHYNVELVAARPRTPTDKGKVERAIRYIRTSFPGLLEPRDLESLNEEALAWCTEEAQTRECPGDRRLTVAARFALERSHLLPLPSAAFDAHDVTPAVVSKRALVRYDGNDYGVPATHIGESVTVHADEQRLTLEYKGRTLATYARLWDRGRRLECDAHTRALREAKRMGQKGAAYADLVAAIPDAAALLQRALAGGENLGSFVAGLQMLRKTHGDAFLGEAVAAGLGRGIRSLHELRREVDALLMRRRESPPAPVLLPVAHPKAGALAELTSLEHYRIT